MSKNKTQEIHLNELSETFSTFVNLRNEVEKSVYLFCSKQFYDKLPCVGDAQEKVVKYSFGGHKYEYVDKHHNRHTIYDIEKYLALYEEKDLLNKIECLEILDIIFKKAKFKISFRGEFSKIKTEIISLISSKYEIQTLVDDYNIINNFKNQNPIVAINNIDAYNSFLDILKKLENKDVNNVNLFNENNELLFKYKNKTLEEYDLSNINFDGKNISGIDISKNPEVHINFDKIVKDLTESSISGYNLNKYTFRNYNLTNTDLRNTGATIDLASCIINKSSKMGSGTLFDENNKFVFLDKKLTPKDIKVLKLKLY